MRTRFAVALTFAFLVAAPPAHTQSRPLLSAVPTPRARLGGSNAFFRSGFVAPIAPQVFPNGFRNGTLVNGVIIARNPRFDFRFRGRFSNRRFSPGFTSGAYGLPYYIPNYDPYSSSGIEQSQVSAEAEREQRAQEAYEDNQSRRQALLERRLYEQERQMEELRQQRQQAEPATTRPMGQSAAPPALEDDQPTTILVFHDQRQAELVRNYAIIGQSLYVMGREHRKIALADLDLPATAKANEEAGLEFRIPGGPRIRR